MGDQGHSFASGHLWSPIMRSSRGKLFVYLAVLGVMCFVVFLLSSAHSNLKQLEGANEKCQQQRDSLSAQLQVVYEHKSRLEKSLQHEKTDHRHTKDEHDKQLQEQESKLQQEKDKQRKLESQLTQLKASYSELEVDKKHAESLIKDQLQFMRTEKDNEIKKLQAHITELLAEKEKLGQLNSALYWKVEQYSNEGNLCRLQQEKFKQELSKCQEELQNASIVGNYQNLNKIEERQKPASTGSTLIGTKDKLNVLERPHIRNTVDNGKDASVVKPAFATDAKLPNVEQAGHSDKNSSFDAMKIQLPVPFDVKSEDGQLTKRTTSRNSNEAHHANGNQLDQVQPPDDSMNQAGERGEYGNGVLPEQLEQPDFRDPGHDDGGNSLKKGDAVLNGYADAAQVRDMMVKSPADANEDSNKKSPLHFPPPDFEGAADRIRNFHMDSNVVKPRVDLPGINDKQYPDEDDEDQEGENDEDPVGGGQGPREKPFQENDFDNDPDSNDNVKHEGVMLSPK